MTDRTLRLAEDLVLPLDAITQTFGVLAVRGAGKSNLAAVMAEEFAQAHLPFVVIDPVGSWFGLRSSADGKGPGLALPIFGGRHGDVPLEATGGALLADVVVDERLSCVIDTSELSESAKIRFLTDFAERLYRRNTEPLHLFLEEADDYLPQRPLRELARCLGAWEAIVRRGRARGLGITLITQRSAVLNKNVLTQIETLVVLRTTSPQDRKAIASWVEYHGQSAELLASLPGLEDGEAWVWSPHWLKVMRRVRIRRRATFDSGATPKAGLASRRPATLADVDLVAIRTRMAATIERVKAEDPRELRRQVAELKAQLTKAEASAARRPAGPTSKPVEIPVLTPAHLTRLEGAVGKLDAGLKRLFGFQADLEPLAFGLRKVMTPLLEELRVLRVPAPVATLAMPRPTPRVAVGAGDPTLGKSGLRRMLVALAQRPGLSRGQLGVRAGLSSRSGSFDTYLSRGRTQGWIAGDSARLTITEAGLAALGSYEPLPEGPALLEHWLRELGGSGAARMLRALADVYPASVTRAVLGERAGLSDRSGSFDTYLSRLRTLELVEGRGELRAAAEFFV
jgi:hypothetical protein